MTVSADQLSEFNTKGFARVPSFLTKEEIDFIRYDSEHASRVSFRFYGVKDVRPECVKKLKDRLLSVCHDVSLGTGTKTDMLSGAIYWRSRRSKSGVTDGWHQDHDSWWLWGRDHVNYLHLYLAIVKSNSNKTGLTLLPWNRLSECSPEIYQLLVAKGAIACTREPGRTTVLRRDSGTKVKVDFDIETIAETPELAEGDLLMFRGDVLHRTQDRETDRLAVSFRMANSKTPIYRAPILEWGSREKFVLAMSNHEKYRYVLEALDHFGDGCPLGKVQEYLDAAYNRSSHVSFGSLLTQKMLAAGRELRRPSA